MALAETATLAVRLTLKDEFSRSLGNARRSLGSFDKLAGQTSDRWYKAGTQIGTGIRNGTRIAAGGIAFLAGNVALGLNSLIELEQQQAQTNAVIKSTGGIAGITADEVGRLAEKYESLNATIGDETIRGAENLLLTFTNVRKEAFEPALAAILDMNTALGKGPEGLNTTVTLVAKALQDPVRGLTALRRVGVAFTKDQEAQIKALVESNDVLGAQRLILEELNKEYGGSFLAQGDTTAGKVAKFRDAIEDLQRALAEALLPALGNVADALSKTLQDPAVIQGVKDLGQSIARLFSPENLAEGGRIMREAFQMARDAAPILVESLRIGAEVVKTAVGIFRSLPPEVQKLAVGAFAINKLTGGLVTNLAGGLIGSVLKQLVSGVVNVKGGVVNVVGAGVPGVGATPVAAGGGKGVGLVGKGIGALSGALTLFLATEVASGVDEVLDDVAQSIRGELDFLPDLSDVDLQWPFGDKGAPDWAKSENPPAALNNRQGLLPGGAGLGGFKPEVYGPPIPNTKPDRLISPQQVATTAAANTASKLGPIIERGIKNGFQPGIDDAIATLKRNDERAATRAEAFKAKMAAAGEAARAGALAGAAKAQAAIAAAGQAQRTATTAAAAAAASGISATVRTKSDAVRVATTAAGAAAALGGRQGGEKAAAAIRDKKLSTSVTVPVSLTTGATYINGRLFQSQITRNSTFARLGQGAFQYS